MNRRSSWFPQSVHLLNNDRRVFSEFFEGEGCLQRRLENLIAPFKRLTSSERFDFR